MRIIQAGAPQKPYTFLQEWWGDVYWECVSCHCVFIPNQDDHVTVNSLGEEWSWHESIQAYLTNPFLQACCSCPNCGYDLGITVPYEPA